ncbi:MAG TPA: hypothetical protein VK007_12415 [Acidimicrobiales bacterium]|nr:hypothetical protein [Acidimicrobiales bacterium]
MHDPSTAESPARRLTPVRVVIVAVIVGIVGLWGYILYLAIGPGRQDPPDRLADPDFAPAAQARCSAALDEVALLPPANATRSAEERAEVIETANEVFEAMLDDLAALAPEGEEGEIVAAWIADWRTYLGDRARYADELREDPTAPFLVSTRQGEQVTEYMDAFAADNRMPACGTPLDV